MDTATQSKLTLAGYQVRYGDDQLLHILITFSSRQGQGLRGQRGLCGHTASRRDWKCEKRICPVCAQKILTQQDGEWRIIPAAVLLTRKSS